MKKLSLLRKTLLILTLLPLLTILPVHGDDSNVAERGGFDRGRENFQRPAAPAANAYRPSEAVHPYGGQYANPATRNAAFDRGAEAGALDAGAAGGAGVLYPDETLYPQTTTNQIQYVPTNATVLPTVPLPTQQVPSNQYNPPAPQTQY